MKLLKKKTRKAIRKNLRKAINRHGPELASHLATGALAGLTALVAANPKKSGKKLRKLGQRIASLPAVEAVVEHLHPHPSDDERSPKSRTDD
ncbi:MAG: hypothetical protein SFU53_13825 [Terrimicrobiaceae bacterium]|nr:hypothetical protein [Terrimicrobiaceae bacterium]